MPPARRNQIRERCGIHRSEEGRTNSGRLQLARAIFPCVHSPPRYVVGVEDIQLDAIDLDHAGNALDLRVGRLLACIKRMDLADSGYGTFRVFCDAEVEWH